MIRARHVAGGNNGRMPFWKPHALAKPHQGQINLRIGDRVVATVDLVDVPAGTNLQCRAITSGAPEAWDVAFYGVY